MEETVKNELDALIQEQKERIPKLIIREGDFFTYYVYDTYIEEEYIKWKENAKRFLEINFIGDKHIDEFNKTCDEKNLHLINNRSY